MKWVLLQVGKTDAGWLREGVQQYEKRLPHYLPFEVITIPDVKRVRDEKDQKEQEGRAILDKLKPADFMVLLDERGKSWTSRQLAEFVQRKMNESTKRLVFVIGGPYGFSPDVYQRANMKLSLSAMTFSHQMVRLFAVEQMYRAMTILRNEPYHHD
ncbi:23S rRNA (pseudouridine(1915)-N(3))-methyltransferase RlmH [Cryomorphaceae bacterium]|nr:23S rRNA (pseudouridine(1915)-N(3))-methyltransferase RlmH [Cryomorphaceae bacterium]